MAVMSYRALFAADVHVGNTLPFARRVNAAGFAACSDRLLDTLDVLDQMAAYADANGIGDLWFIGDLLDKRLLDGATLKYAMEKILSIADRGMRIRLIPGNHEAQDAAASMYTLRVFEGVRPEIEVWDAESSAELGGVWFRGVPYKPDEVARETVSRVRDSQNGAPTVLLLHQSLVGGKVGTWVNPHGLNDTDLAGFLAVLAGHFHTPQAISIAPLRMYLGAPVQHNFGDAGEERGFWDMTFTTAGVERTMVRTASPEFHKWDYKLMKTFTEPPPEFKRGDYITMVIKGTPAELKSYTSEVERTLKAVKETFGARAAFPHWVKEAERKERAKVTAEDGKTLTWPAAVSGYIDACDVTGLSRSRLEALAAEALEAIHG